MTRNLLAIAIAAALPGTALAIDLSRSTQTTATPDKVWSVMGDFDSISKWHPAVASSPATKGNTPGSVRTLTLKAPGNPTITETLTRYDAKTYRYSYDITAVDPKVLPVVNYHSTIKVEKARGGSKITWRGHFDAAKGASDKDATKAVAGVYEGGLAGIKTEAEQ